MKRIIITAIVVAGLALLCSVYSLLPQNIQTGAVYKLGDANGLDENTVQPVVPPTSNDDRSDEHKMRTTAELQSEQGVTGQADYPASIFRKQSEFDQFDNLVKEFFGDPVTEKKEHEKQLKELQLSVFGHIPSNPIAALQNLKSDRLAAMLRLRYAQPTEVREFGVLLSEFYEVGQLLAWFELKGPKSGLEGQVLTKTFSWIVYRNAKNIRNSPKLAQRTLALIEVYLAETKKNSSSISTSGAIWSSLSNLCPIDGGLELIRRWTVTNPHGDEATETSLVEMLQHWPIQDAKALIIETLETNRAGAIKGVVSAWDNTKSGFSEWNVSEAKQLLEAPLAEAVKNTKRSTGVLYAAIFAAKDLLKPRALEIADALLMRRDNAYVSSQAFSFLQVHSQQEAESTWVAWLESDSEYQMLAACMSAGSYGEVSSKPNSINKLFELASKSHNRTDLQGAAGTALCQVDSNYSRTLDILHLWLNSPQIAEPTLVSAGRMVLWGPRDEVESFLLDEITDPHKQPKERHTALFLLSIIDVNTALGFCENKDYVGKITELTKLLVAAVYGTSNRQRTKAVRDGCNMAEPDWIKRIRLGQSVEKSHGLKEHAEERVVSYARSRP